MSSCPKWYHLINTWAGRSSFEIYLWVKFPIKWKTTSGPEFLQCLFYNANCCYTIKTEWRNPPSHCQRQQCFLKNVERLQGGGSRQQLFLGLSHLVQRRLRYFFQISAGRLKYVNDFLKFILYGSVKRPQVYRPSGRLFEVIRRGGATKYKTSIACWKRCCDMISQRSPVYGVSSTWSMRFLYGNLCRETD